MALSIIWTGLCEPTARTSKPRISRQLSLASSARPAPPNAQTCLDFAYDYAEAGLLEDARRLLGDYAGDSSRSAIHPMIFYTLGFLSPERDEGKRWYERGAAACPDYCFPARLEEMVVLQAALNVNPADARAHYYLGNLLYDKMRRPEAIAHWEKSCALDPSFAIPWRNLGIACCNVLRDEARALCCYEAARKADPTDARILYELDQLRKRMGLDHQKRLEQLEPHRSLVDQRDDLTVELVSFTTKPAKAKRRWSFCKAGASTPGRVAKASFPANT